MFVVTKTFVWTAWDDQELELENTVLGYSTVKKTAYHFAVQEYQKLCREGIEDSEQLEEEDLIQWETVLEIDDVEAKYKAIHEFRDNIWNNDLWDDDMEENHERGPHGYYIEVKNVKDIVNLP